MPSSVSTFTNSQFFQGFPTKYVVISVIFIMFRESKTLLLDFLTGERSRGPCHEKNYKPITCNRQIRNAYRIIDSPGPRSLVFRLHEKTFKLRHSDSVFLFVCPLSKPESEHRSRRIRSRVRFLHRPSASQCCRRL